MKRFGLRRADRPATIRNPSSNEGKEINVAKPLRLTQDPTIAGLNIKQGLFVRHYLESNNATEAAKKAGYSSKTAHAIGANLLRHIKVAAEIQRRRAAVIEKLDFSADQAMRDVVNMGRSNMGDYFTIGEQGQPLLNWENLTREQTACLQDLTVEEFVDGRSDKRKVRRVKFKLVDKLASIELWGRFAGMFNEKHTHDHKHTLVGALLDEIDGMGRRSRVIEGTVLPDGGDDGEKKKNT